MRKRKLLLFILSLVLTLTSCKTIKEVNFERFINSNKMDLTVMLKYNYKSGGSYYYNVMDLVLYNEIISIDMDSGQDIIIDAKEGKQYYYFA